MALSFNFLYVTTIIKAATINVSISDIGMEYSTPSSPKNTGNINANPTPKTISLTMDSAVEATAFPIACKKINVALFTQAKIIMHKYMRKALIPN